jgi:hypothetical protein
MRSRFCGRLLIGVVALAVIAPPVHSQEAGQEAQVVGDAEQVVEPNAGFFAFAGGFVRGKLVRTQTAATALTEGAIWRPLLGAVLQRIVPAGTTDMFNVTFSGECQVRSLGSGDTARIRIAHFVNGVQIAPMEPYDGDRRFCSSINPVATHSAQWTRRVGPGAHTVRVEIMTVDFFPDNGVITSVFDDWTL